MVILQFRLMKHKTTTTDTFVMQTPEKINRPLIFFPLTVLLTLLINLFFVVAVFAQTLTVNNAAVFNSTSITVRGSAEFNGTSLITNQNLISVSGDLTNNASYGVFGTSQGTIELNGNLQLMNGTDSILFHHLILNGSGQKMMHVAAAVGGSTTTGTLTLSNGILDLNGQRLHLLNTNPASLINSGGALRSETVDFNSMVIWNTMNGSASYTIPFVNAGGQPVPFKYDINSGNAGKIYVATYATGINNLPMPASPVAVTSLATLANGDPQQMVDRFWYVFSQSPVTADLTFGYDPATESGSGSGLVLAQVYDQAGANWSPPVPNQFNPQAGRVLLPAATSSGIFGLGIGASPLPVELLEFRARKSGEEVICTWITLSEKDNDYFTVERSRNGYYFETVGLVQGAGTTTAISNYSFTDTNPLNGLSYYRLKQTDFDGQYAYSQVESVRFGESESDDLQLDIFPNPADQFTNVVIILPEDESAKLTLTDATGRIVSVRTVNYGDPVMEFALNELKSGIYFINVTTERASKTSRLVVRH
jgi:hypothetical protein